MDDEVKRAGRHGRLRDRRQHAIGLIGGGGRDLGQSDANAFGPCLMEQQVRERPADVDASYPPHARPGTSAAPTLTSFVYKQFISIQTIGALSRREAAMG